MLHFLKLKQKLQIVGRKTNLKDYIKSLRNMQHFAENNKFSQEKQL